MSKLERFMHEGHYANVIKHLRKMKQPAKIALAFSHADYGVNKVASERLAHLGEPGARQLANSLRSNNMFEVEYAVSGLSRMPLKHVKPFAKNIADSGLFLPKPINLRIKERIIEKSAKLLERIRDPSVLPQVEAKMRELDLAKSSPFGAKFALEGALLELMRVARQTIKKTPIAPPRVKKK
ncbi:MAG TPA: hypothetical protein VGQ00_03230 [Candidatus Norongarragalinales archaeon]|jgi:hypothetical protein|nr:hypothetical protein [Candidatus Norongarragalinales archaeon]